MPEPSILAMRSVWAFVSSTFATPFVMTLRAGFRPHPLVQVATGTSSSQSVHSILVLLSVFMSLFLSVGLVKRGRIDQDSNLAVTHPSRLCPEKTQKRKVAGTEKRVRTPSAPASEGRFTKKSNFFPVKQFCASRTLCHLPEQTKQPSTVMLVKSGIAFPGPCPQDEALHRLKSASFASRSSLSRISLGIIRHIVHLLSDLFATIPFITEAADFAPSDLKLRETRLWANSYLRHIGVSIGIGGGSMLAMILRSPRRPSE
jgi:hypothetical protein